MPLKQLVETAAQVDVQRTTLATDALGRYICSTWSEVTQNGGPAFDAVVIGSGMYGAYCAEKIFRLGAAKQLRVLVLEAGSFLVSEHVQNLANIGLGVPAPLPPAMDPGTPREIVWGIPWRGNVPFPGLAYCVGGKSLYWGGWCPRLTTADLALWPLPVAADLQALYWRLENETGTAPSTDFISGPLYEEIVRAFGAAAPSIAHIDTSGPHNGVHEPPLAVQGAQPASGLFSFDKFSSAPLMVEAIRQDVGQSGVQDSQRRLFLVPGAHVVRLGMAGNTVNAIEVAFGAQRAVLPIPPSCAVILAASTIESTRLALTSFPSPLMGGNLMGHLRTDFTARIRRAAFQPLPLGLETAAALIRGGTAHGRFHIQITAAADQGLGSDDLLFRMIPDLDLLDAVRANDDPEWVTVTLRGIAEMVGDRGGPSLDPNQSWMNLSPFEKDEYGIPRAWVNLAASPGDVQLWQDMDAAMQGLLQTVAGSSSNIQYAYDNGWQTTPHPLNRPFPSWHQGLGETYHEAGTLWMGTSAGSSVTDTNGKFHHVANAYACDQSVFPTVGSVNPVLTGLTLARRLAQHIVNVH